MIKTSKKQGFGSENRGLSAFECALAFEYECVHQFALAFECALAFVLKLELIYGTDRSSILITDINH